MAEEKSKLGLGKYAIGAVGGIILYSAFGFGWFGLPNLGFQTGGSAQEMVDVAVTNALVPVCVATAQAEPDTAKLIAFDEASNFQKRNHVRDNGWTTSRDVEAPCAEALAEAREVSA